MIRLVTNIAILLSLLLTSNITKSEETKVKNIKEIEINAKDIARKAVKLLKENKAQEACNILDKALIKKYDPQLTFLKGQCKFNLMDYSASAFQYQLMLEQNTNLPRVRVELAKTLATMGKVNEAEKEYKKVLEGDLPKTVRNNINNQLKNIDTRRRWGGLVSFIWLFK